VRDEVIVQEYIRENGACPFRDWFDRLDAFLSKHNPAE